MTQIINIFGGPGVGKSTFAAALFSLMKEKNISCENLYEHAKILTWEKNSHRLSCQPYVFGQQLLLQTRLLGQVDYVITDSPLLLSVLYNKKYPETFNKSVVDIFNTFNNINLLLRRKFEYIGNGRNETYYEAVKTDEDLNSILIKHNIKNKAIMIVRNNVTESARIVLNNILNGVT